MDEKPHPGLGPTSGIQVGWQSAGPMHTHRRPWGHRPLLPRGARWAEAQGKTTPAGPGIIEPNEQLKFTSFPCHRHPASGHPLRDLPAHRGLPARRTQRGADRALPPGPPRSARPSRPVRSAARRITPLVPPAAATAPNPERSRTRSMVAFGESPRAYPPICSAAAPWNAGDDGAQNGLLCRAL